MCDEQTFNELQNLDTPDMLDIFYESESEENDMNNKEFQTKLQKMYDENLGSTKRDKRTLNELCYVLRMDKENDYNISLVENGVWGVCIPSVRDFFIPVKDLAKKVVEVVLDDEDYGFDGICLTVHVEE